MERKPIDPSKLTEISLSGEEPGDDAKPVQDERISKTNSLRRFFKLTNKRVNEALSNEDQPTNSDDTSGIEEAGAVAPKKEEEQPKRFHLRLRGLHKHSFYKKDKTEDPNAPSGSQTAKMGLKASVSNYLQSVFKRNQKGKAEAARTEDEQDADEEANEMEIRHEDVHRLSISEDADEAPKP